MYALTAKWSHCQLPPLSSRNHLLSFSLYLLLIRRRANFSCVRPEFTLPEAVGGKISENLQQNTKIKAHVKTETNHSKARLIQVPFFLIQPSSACVFKLTW